MQKQSISDEEIISKKINVFKLLMKVAFHMKI